MNGVWIQPIQNVLDIAGQSKYHNPIKNKTFLIFDVYRVMLTYG